MKKHVRCESKIEVVVQERWNVPPNTANKANCCLRVRERWRGRVQANFPDLPLQGWGGQELSFPICVCELLTLWCILHTGVSSLV